MIVRVLVVPRGDAESRSPLIADRLAVVQVSQGFSGSFMKEGKEGRGVVRSPLTLGMRAFSHYGSRHVQVIEYKNDCT